MSKPLSIYIKGVPATQILAEDMSKDIKCGTVIALTGDLGSGKTTFTKGYARGLGVIENVGSPTFKLVNEYQGRKLKLYHIDCYRLKNETEFFNIGGEQYLDPLDGITMIEWSEKIAHVLPMNCINIILERIPDSPNDRIINIEGWSL